MKYLQELARAQQQKAKSAQDKRALPEVNATAKVVDGKLVITVDLFPSPISSNSGKSVLLTSHNKYVTIAGTGLKARFGINVSVPRP
jgi:hypothetical protein